MLIGYMRISKADGSQAVDLQRDALLAAGIEPDQLYQDLASGKRDDRPGLAAALKALRRGDVLWLRGPRVLAADPAREAAWCSACTRAAGSRRPARWLAAAGDEAVIVTVEGDDDRALLWVQLPGR